MLRTGRTRVSISFGAYKQKKKMLTKINGRYRKEKKIIIKTDVVYLFKIIIIARCACDITVAGRSTVDTNRCAPAVRGNAGRRRRRRIVRCRRRRRRPSADSYGGLCRRRRRHPGAWPSPDTIGGLWATGNGDSNGRAFIYLLSNGRILLPRRAFRPPLRRP